MKADTFEIKNNQLNKIETLLWKENYPRIANKGKKGTYNINTRHIVL
jgi:hypothetical protein